MEPNLSQIIDYVIYVNDGAVDPFKLAFLNALDAVNAGAEILSYHEVTGFIVKQNEVLGVKVRDNTKYYRRILFRHCDKRCWCLDR